MTDGDVRMVSVKSGFISGGFCSKLDSYSRALIFVRASKVKGCVRCVQMVYASSKSRAQKKILNSFVAIRAEKDKGEEV